MIKVALSADDPRRKRTYTRSDTLDLAAPLLWTVPNVLSPEECRAQIARVEAHGATPAPITTAGGFEMRPDIRNNTRVMIDDVELAAELFARVSSCLPDPMFGDMSPSGANERLRYYRYERGQRFAPHFDGSFRRDDREESLLTFMIYLNDDFRGGDTEFLGLETVVKPEVGTALFFQHRQLHEGCTVEEGVKYVLRSDIMYRGSQLTRASRRTSAPREAARRRG